MREHFASGGLWGWDVSRTYGYNPYASAAAALAEAARTAPPTVD